MTTILIISWLYHGVLIHERWEFPSMSDCMQTAYSINVESAKHISCTKKRR